jgi:hypothetical protein
MSSRFIDRLAEIVVAPHDIQGHLDAAEALVPREVIEETGVADELQECRRSGYNHLWMATLQDVGKSLESKGKDATLPPEYWKHLAVAAQRMELDAFVPFFAGKAARLPKRDWYDVIAAIVALERRLPEPLRAKHSAAASSMKSYVDWLETLDSSHPVLFRAPETGAIRARFMEEKLFEADPPDETVKRINRDFMAMFDELFALVTDPDLPDELQDAAWSVIDANTFEIQLHGMMSSAEVWWRA